jgi:hypothetical protein
MSYKKFELAKTGAMVAPIFLFTEFEDNWKYFFTEATMTPVTPGKIDKIVTVKNFSRRRGPGAPGKSVAGHARSYARYAKTKGSARPGNPYIVTEPAALGAGYRERRQFALLGDDHDIQAYAHAKAKMKIILTDYRGWSSVIQAAPGAVLINP